MTYHKLERRMVSKPFIDPLSERLPLFLSCGKTAKEVESKLKEEGIL
jgi:hypothetical protein